GAANDRWWLWGDNIAEMSYPTCDAFAL
ncbi:hypothetical protein A2U01_0059582, partial [Trifolium medium]|nr:hypothetical protein [Trifolium medium]